jgi:hypothetical protein
MIHQKTVETDLGQYRLHPKEACQSQLRAPFGRGEHGRSADTGESRISSVQPEGAKMMDESGCGRTA